MPRTPKQYFRWFLVQFGLFDKGACRLGIDEIRKDDTFIVSFPKSGNTWLRFLIAHLISDRNDITFRNIDQLVPDIYTSYQQVNHLPSPRYIKAHHSTQFADFPKTLYIVRDYRDVLVSYYGYQQALGDFSGTFSSFVCSLNAHHPFGSWKDHVYAAINFERSNPARLLFLRYEDLLSEPVKELDKIISFLQITPNRSNVEVIEKCDFPRLRELEEKQGSPFRDKSGKYFVREGKSGGWKKVFTNKEEALISEEENVLLRKLGYGIT